MLLKITYNYQYFQKLPITTGTFNLLKLEIDSFIKINGFFST